MAVLRQDLQRTTFQDKQIKLMTEMTVDLEGLRKDSDKNFTDLRTSLLSGFSSSIQGLYYSFVRYIETGTAAFVSDIEDIMQDVREGIDEDSDRREKDSLKEHQRQADKYRSYIGQQNKELSDKIGKVVNGLFHIASLFGISWDRYTELADQVSDLQNIYVRNTSTTRADAVTLRDSIVSTVKEMNSRTGDLYSSIESFELIVGMINTTGIKNREFYEEYAEIFLESQKTMNLNLGTLAEFSDKFYRKYNFSSQTMEHLTDSIRQNTAGTSVSEDKMMQFMQELDSDIMSYAMRMGGNVEGNYTKIQDNITSVYSWLNTQGYDSDYLFKLITGAASGDISNKTTLESFGVSSDGGYLMRQLMTDPSGLMTQLINAIGSRRIGTGFGDYGRQIASAYGIDYDTAVLAERRGLSQKSYEDFLSNRPFSEDPANEIWKSADERTANATEDIAIKLADTQEAVGIKMSSLTTIVQDIYRLLSAVYGASVGQTLFNFLAGKFTSGFGTGSGISGSLGGIGGALGVGAAALLIGVVLGLKSSVDIIAKNDKQDVESFKLSDDVDLSQPIFINKTGTDTFGLSNDETSRASIASYINSKYNTVSAYTGQSISDGSFLGTVGSGFANLGKDILGPGWFATSPDSPWYYKVPVIGGIASAIGGSGGIIDIESKRDEVNKTFDKINSYLSKDEVTLFKLLWYVLSQNGGNAVEFSTPLYENISTYGDLVSKGKVPISIDKEGKVLKTTTVSSFGSPYYEYFSGYSEGNIPLYKLGTPYVPNDQLSYLHEGEAVIPAMENPFSKYSTSRYNRNEELRQIVEHTKTIAAEQPDDHGSEFNKIIDTMKDILSFLQYWRTDNISRDSVNDVLQSARNTNLKLQILTGESTLATDSVG